MHVDVWKTPGAAQASQEAISNGGNKGVEASSLLVAVNERTRDASLIEALLEENATLREAQERELFRRHGQGTSTQE